MLDDRDKDSRRRGLRGENRRKFEETERNKQSGWPEPDASWDDEADGSGEFENMDPRGWTNDDLPPQGVPYDPTIDDLSDRSPSAGTEGSGFDGNSDAEAVWTDRNEWLGEPESMDAGDWAIDDLPPSGGGYDVSAEDLSDHWPPFGIDDPRQVQSGTETEPDRGQDAGYYITARSGSLAEPPQRVRRRTRRFLLSISAVVVLGLMVGGYLWWDQKTPPLLESNPSPTPAEQVFADLVEIDEQREKHAESTPQQALADPSVVANPVELEEQRIQSAISDERQRPTERFFVDPAVLEEQRKRRLEERRKRRLESAAQRRLTDPDVAAVFYAQDAAGEAELAVQPLTVTDLKRTYQAANQLRDALQQKPLNDREKQRLAEGVLGEVILDFDARRSRSVNRSSLETEIDRRVEQIAAAVKSDRDFKQWVLINYGSQAAFRERVERAIVQQRHLARKGLTKQESVDALRGDLEIMWAELPQD